MKRFLPLFLIIAACSSSKPAEVKQELPTKQPERPTYRIYQYEQDAFVCDKSKKGNFTYCDAEGEVITGIINNRNNTIAIYENGIEVSGLTLYPKTKLIKNYYKQSPDQEYYTTFYYYQDGSIASKEIESKTKGMKTKIYNQGEKYNSPEDEEQILILIDALKQ